MLMWEKPEVMKNIVAQIEKPDILRKNIKDQFLNSSEKKQLEQKYLNECVVQDDIVVSGVDAICIRQKNYDKKVKHRAMIYAHGYSTDLEVAKYEMAKLAIECNCFVIGIDYDMAKPGTDNNYKGQQDFYNLIIEVYTKPSKFYHIDKTKIVIAGGSTGAWITLGAAKMLA